MSVEGEPDGISTRDGESDGWSMTEGEKDGGVDICPEVGESEGCFEGGDKEGVEDGRLDSPEEGRPDG